MSAALQTLWREDFADGLDLEERWTILTAGDFTADDGVATPVSEGLRVRSGATTADTDQPAFTKDVGGVFGHLKWFVSTQQQFETGGGALRFEHRAGARTFGMTEHPYGDGVADPGTDLRLGSLVLNVMDFESGMVFDFWICEQAIYPYYERIPIPGAEMEVFGSVREPVARRPSDVHDLCIEIDATAGTAQWEVDGRVIATVERIGEPNAGWTTCLDHGGRRGTARLGRVATSIGLMTLLDASLPPSPRGLVDLGLRYNHPQSFSGGPRLFGQGVEATIEHVTVLRG